MSFFGSSNFIHWSRRRLITTELFGCVLVEFEPEVCCCYCEDACFIALAEIYFIPVRFIVFEYHYLLPLAVGIAPDAAALELTPPPPPFDEKLFVPIAP